MKDALLPTNGFMRKKLPQEHVFKGYVIEAIVISNMGNCLIKQKEKKSISLKL